ncbi:MAG: glycosyltransferase family 2 protein [Anaerolineales bacterium]|nr:glycosyltransferase family 2 protein [Anaerolineales bacterium]
MSAPLVSLILVLYNSAEHLEDCLHSLLADALSPPFEVWVVDNASADNGAELAESFAARASHLHVLRNPTNRGYAGGVNSALPYARGEFVAVLNPDSVVEPGWLAPIVTLLQAQPEVGAVSPLILLHTDEEAGLARINSAGQNVHVTGLGFNRQLGRPRAAAGSAPQPVSGLHGAAFVIRRSLLDRMRGWDESGFLYHEDVALSWLLHLMGYELYCVPASVVWHKYHLTMYPEKLFLLERNRWALLLTHLGGATRALLAPLLLFTECLMWGFCLLRGPAFLHAKLASYRWVAAQAPQLRERRRFIETLRRRSDRHVLRRLRWNYEWDQFFSLGRERGVSTRQPPGGLPVRWEIGE